MNIKVLLIGNGAREHALAETIKRSPQNPALFSFMKSHNPGIASLSDAVKIGDYGDLEGIKAFAKEVEAELCVIGPEAPLEKGVVDALESIGIHSIGPRKGLARLETSKGFTRELMAKYNIDGNPKFKVFTSIAGIKEFLEELGEFVIKPDGLTAGKGVKVFGEHLINLQDGLDYCEDVLKTHNSVVVEEKLVGEEFSLQCFTDGKTVIPTPPVQDHKRAYVGDKGPNTGGMGSYSFENHSLPFLKHEDILEAVRITKDVADALYREIGAYYKGIMYGGFIVTKNGVKLIEYNARFGDPEAMNVLPILKTDFIEISKAIIDGKLHELDIKFEPKATVCKYAVPEGYPDNPVVYKKVDISDVSPKVKMYFASVETKSDGLYMTSSRAISFVGIANTIDEAEMIAETAVKKVKGPVFHREDIGTRELIDKRVEHMRIIRGE